MPANVTEHPSVPQLTQFNQGRLTTSEANAVETHLIDCPRCCDTLAQLDTETDAFTSQLRVIYDELRKVSATEQIEGTVPPAPHHLDKVRPHDPYRTVVDPVAHNQTDVKACVPTMNAAEQAGQVFGDYEQLELIASGGMGVVYKAKQRSLDRVVALKMIRSDVLVSETAIQRFHVEAKAAAALDHPNIVPIFEIGEYDGNHYFTMAYVAGQRLSDKVLKGKPLGARAAAELMLPIIDAVGFAHQHGIVHRDLKPDNILIDAQGRPRVTDFGLAKNLEGDIHLTAHGAILGTPSFMAPEQATGRQQHIGPATDIYALGGILYFLLSAHPPCIGDSITEILARLMTEPPVPLRTLNPSVPEALSAICMRCLSKNPADRYATAGALKAVLVEFLQTSPAAPAKEAAASRTSSRLPVALGLAACVGLAIAVGGWVWHNRETPKATETAAVVKPGVVPAATTEEAPKKVAAKVAEFAWPDLKHHDFPLEVEMVGSKTGPDGIVQIEAGTRVAFRIKAGRDAEVGVWTMDADGEVRQLLPNDHEQARCKAGEARMVPGDAAKEYWFEAEVSHNPSGEASPPIEYVRVIATTKPMDLPRGETQGIYQVYKGIEKRKELSVGLRKITLKSAEAPTDAVAEAEIRFQVVPRKRP